MKPKKAVSAGPSRLKRLLIPVIVLFVLLAALFAVIFLVDREPLSAKEILAKQEWTEDELRQALSRSFTLQTDRDSRQEVMAHLRKYLHTFSPEEQSRIRVAAAADAMNRSLEQLRLLEPEAREQLFDKMNRQADRNYERINSMPEEERRHLRETLASEESKAIMSEANKIVTSKMTPEERSAFAPLTQKWLQIMGGI